MRRDFRRSRRRPPGRLLASRYRASRFARDPLPTVEAFMKPPLRIYFVGTHATGKTTTLARWVRDATACR